MAYLEGQLRQVTESGEHTGYVLEIEVDVSAIQGAEGLANEQVALTGDIEFVDFPERGKILVFRATSSATIDEDEEEDSEEEPGARLYEGGGHQVVD